LPSSFSFLSSPLSTSTRKRAISKTNVCELGVFLLLLPLPRSLFVPLSAWIKKKVLRDLCRQKKSCHEQKGAPETFLTEQILIRHLKLFSLLFGPLLNGKAVLLLVLTPASAQGN
jgi:hypothetical protein